MSCTDLSRRLNLYSPKKYWGQFLYLVEIEFEPNRYLRFFDFRSQQLGDCPN